MIQPVLYGLKGLGGGYTTSDCPLRSIKLTINAKYGNMIQTHLQKVWKIPQSPTLCISHNLTHVKISMCSAMGNSVTLIDLFLVLVNHATIKWEVCFECSVIFTQKWLLPPVLAGGNISCI